MSSSGKFTQVADSLHYAIPITAIEKELISTQIFSRLHNILQNSTVFYTFPSSRTSRFAHSLGCMHLAGEMFRSSLVNASPRTCRQFLERTFQELQNMSSEATFGSDLDLLLRGQELDAASELAKPRWPFRDPLYDRSLLGSLSGRADQFTFLMCFQAVRLAAALHDLGHPPFSHVAEQALGELWGGLREKLRRKEALTARETEFDRIWGHFRRAPQKGQKDPAFHEVLGNHLAERVLAVVLGPNGRSAQEMLHLLLLRRVTLGILKEAKPCLRALHGLVDGSLDADRLDFVARDSIMSGVGKDPLPYDRLLNCFEVVKSPCAAAGVPADEFAFAPRAQALGSIEEFFARRFGLYKFLVFHHRVAKTDGLLKAVIKQLSQEYLASQCPVEKAKTNSYCIPADISGLWLALDPGIHTTHGEYVTHYIQWDDAWLLTTLRQHYFKKRAEHRGARGRTLIEAQLEEVLSSKKSYFSLVKRVDSFAAIDEAFLGAIPKDFDLGLISPSRLVGEESILPRFQEIYAQFVDYCAAFATGTSLTFLRQTKGFVLVHLVRYLNTVGSEDSWGRAVVERAVSRVRKHFALDDAIVIEKVLTPGVTGEFKLVIEGKIVDLSTVSRIADELNQGAYLFPPFFVYVYRQEPGQRENLEQEFPAMRVALGKALWTELAGHVTSMSKEKVQTRSEEEEHVHGVRRESSSPRSAHKPSGRIQRRRTRSPLLQAAKR